MVINRYRYGNNFIKFSKVNLDQLHVFFNTFEHSFCFFNYRKLFIMSFLINKVFKAGCGSAKNECWSTALVEAAPHWWLRQICTIKSPERKDDPCYWPAMGGGSALEVSVYPTHWELKPGSCWPATYIKSVILNTILHLVSQYLKNFLSWLSQT